MLNVCLLPNVYTVWAVLDIDKSLFLSPSALLLFLQGEKPLHFLTIHMPEQFGIINQQRHVDEKCLTMLYLVITLSHHTFVKKTQCSNIQKLQETHSDLVIIIMLFCLAKHDLRWGPGST